VGTVGDWTWREKRINRMPTLRISGALRSYTDGCTEISVSGQTVAEAIDDLFAQYPALKPHLTNSAGILRPFVNLFLGETNIRDMQGLETPLHELDKLLLIPSIAGG
jgi:molybdopterin converting factor small subunit